MTATKLKHNPRLGDVLWWEEDKMDYKPGDRRAFFVEEDDFTPVTWFGDGVPVEHWYKGNEAGTGVVFSFNGSSGRLGRGKSNGEFHYLLVEDKVSFPKLGELVILEHVYTSTRSTGEDLHLWREIKEVEDDDERDIQ